MKKEYKIKMQQRAKLRNEGMLFERGWERLSQKFPPKSTEDGESFYISHTCLFIINRDDYKQCCRDPKLGVIFAGKEEGELHLSYGAWYETYDHLNLYENEVQDDIFWKEIECPNLVSLYEE